MEGANYILTGDEIDGSVQYVFDLNGRIMNVYYRLNNEAQHRYLVSETPVSVCELKLFYKNLVEAEKQVKLKETPSDLSFKRFWDTYDVKASKRKQSMNIWDKMTDTDKILCLLYIPRYNFIKVNDNTTKMYANTFLNQKGWL